MGITQTFGCRAQWDEHGFVSVPGLVDSDQVSALRQVCDAILRKHLANNPETNEPGDPDGRAMRHLNHPAYHEGDPDGLRLLLDTIADERILDLVNVILGERALFRCTTYWYNPVSAGKDGHWHRDIQFVYPDEADQRRIISEATPQESVQIMLALIETEDNEFVPGTHLRWDSEEEYRIRLGDDQANNRSDRMPGAVRFHQEPGDVIAFHPYGLHRGRYHVDKARRTLMLSYSTESAATEDYFTDQPWFLMPGYLNALEPDKQAFYRRFVDRYSSFWRR
ncbi:MAG: hypothetical protein CMJ18_22565 [Phycisphaeraceae bacterium]|nr:hypothetical protein [Phycisphaeraceae bacterium]